MAELEAIIVKKSTAQFHAALLINYRLSVQERIYFGFCNIAS